MTFYPGTKKRISVSKGGVKEDQLSASVVDQPTKLYSDFRKKIIADCDKILQKEITNEERALVLSLRSKIDITL